jgi:flagellum-specific ATP synthase
MKDDPIEALRTGVSLLEPTRPIGRITAIEAARIAVEGLPRSARLGDRVRVVGTDPVEGEIIALRGTEATILPDGPVSQARIRDAVELLGPDRFAPSDDWLGRVIDPFGSPLDGRQLRQGPEGRPVRAHPPPAASRRRLGERLRTGLAVFDTMLPLVQGQRVGLFAGSGVGKSSLLARFAKGIAADVVVIALIGERGREVREFVEETLGPEGMARAVVVAATSDRPALVRRRCAWAAMAVAEHFRDSGRQVLLLADSVTRFAEAHREVALAAGESAALRGYPPSTAHEIMALAERAGPGDRLGRSGDITAVFSVLVAGSDMDEPVADILRGTLDGHIVLDRDIAERGRYPAIDLLRSVSRSLPRAATAPQNVLIAEARSLLGAYSRAELMVRAGLYSTGSDPVTDRAITLQGSLDAFMAEDSNSPDAAFARLAEILSGPNPG